MYLQNRCVAHPEKSGTDSVVKLLIFQRIIGRKINFRLRLFGQAIDGNIDLGGDGLPDIVVGSQGAAVVLRYPAQ